MDERHARALKLETGGEMRGGQIAMGVRQAAGHD